MAALQMDAWLRISLQGIIRGVGPHVPPRNLRGGRNLPGRASCRDLFAVSEHVESLRVVFPRKSSAWPGPVLIWLRLAPQKL